MTRDDAGRPPSQADIEAAEYMLGGSYEDPTPTCDICDEPLSGLDWNGDTGCHLTCEEKVSAIGGGLPYRWGDQRP